MSGAWASVGLLVALVVLFVAERIVGEGGARTVLMWLGVLGVVGTTGWKGWLLSRAKGQARQVEQRLLYAFGGVLGALVLYALSTEWGMEALGLEREAAERWGGALSALWPAVMIVSLTALLFMELAYRRMPVAEAVELRRVTGASFAGLTVALSVVFLFSVNYVASERDVKKDVSYFKTTKPSETTIRMVEGLDEPVKVVLFYPKVNEVLDQLEPYFKTVEDASKQLTVVVRDHALAPELARQHRIRGNGVVALLQGEGEEQQAEQFEVGTELEVARSRLRTLDGRFQKAFARLTQTRRELYVTTGHDERTDHGVEGDAEGDRTTEFDKALSRGNIETRKLGMAQGLANRVPEEAPAVAVIGPRKPLLPEEAESLRRYVEDGGRLVVMVDPDADHGLTPLLHGLGLELRQGVLASEKNHLRRTHTPADRGIVFANSYSSHPTVTMASRHSSRVATVFLEGGSLERWKGEQAIGGAKVIFPIRGSGDYWLDTDGDWSKDEGEKTGAMNLMAAVTVPNDDGDDGRAVVIADGDFVTDQVIRNPGNGLVIGDIMQWLLGQEQILGDTTSEEDVRIEHTRDEDKVWFYLTSFGAPLPILGVGIWTAMRRRRRRYETHRSSDEERGDSGEDAR